jgi:hypothetical protein
MKNIKVIPLLLIALTLMACSFTVNVPSTTTGETKVFEIEEEALSKNETNSISIEMGAGSLNIQNGADHLIEGSVRYNVDSWEPEITRSSSEITISQKNISEVSIPDGDIKNEWNLKFGDEPIDLHLSTGAYQGNLDLSGLSITSLSISDGASKSTVKFDTLNPVEMDQLTYKTGASDVELLGLGNANVRNISFDSGVGSYTLDFSGDLQEDINVQIHSGMSNVSIIIPKDVQARVVFSSGLSNIDASGTWTIRGDSYECGTSGPLITINLDMAVGNLQLTQK